MNATIIKVSGMHCDACKMLVKMELEDLGLEENIKTIELEGDNTGTIALENVNDEKIMEAKEVINQMEQYEVL